MKIKKYSIDQRLKKLEKSVGELYLFMRVVLSEIQKENEQDTNPTE